jgi:hypothetical protein
VFGAPGYESGWCSAVLTVGIRVSIRSCLLLAPHASDTLSACSEHNTSPLSSQILAEPSRLRLQKVRGLEYRLPVSGCKTLVEGPNKATFEVRFARRLLPLLIGCPVHEPMRYVPNSNSEHEHCRKLSFPKTPSCWLAARKGEMLDQWMS